MSTIGAIIVWIIFGLVVGAIARLLYPGRQPMSVVATILLGILGSLVGGFFSWLIFGAPNEAYQPAGWILSIVGAIILVWIHIAMTRPRITV